MLGRLVTVGVVAHIHHLHLADLMDHAAIVALVEQRRHIEDRVQHRHEFFTATHQVDKTLRVVEHAPGVVPAVAFGEGIAPFQRRERSLETAVGVAAAHQAAFLVEDILVVQSPSGI